MADETKETTGGRAHRLDAEVLAYLRERRESENETPNDVIRRMIGLPPRRPQPW